MKKILIGILLALCFAVTGEVIVVDANDSYSTGGVIENTTIQITENNMYNVTSGTLEISNVKFEDGMVETISKIITIGADATLILNNVDFSAISGSCAIVLNGKMIANNVNFGSRFTNAITLNSTKENPCVLGGDVLLNKISIDNGYITLNEDVNMLTITNVQLENAFVGKRVVTGNNTFASYYVDKFKFVDAHEDGLVFDYVGYDYDSYSDDVKSSDALIAGDIISTQGFAAYKDGDTYYLANKYCTGISYIKNKDISSSCVVSGGTLSNFHLNNINCLMSQNFLKPSRVLDTSVTANIKVVCDGEQIGSTKQVGFYNGIDWNVFVDIPEGYEFENVEGDNVTVNCDFLNSKFAKCIISTTEQNSTYVFDVIVNVKEEVKTTNVDILLESDSEVYSSENLIDKIKPYYEIDGNKHYLEFEASFGGENVTEIVNAGDYTITITSNQPENICFNNFNLNFSISPCEIGVTYLNTNHRYDGSEKNLTAELNGVLGDDNVNLILENNTGINVGSYIVTARIDNSNYILSEESKSCTLVISKGIYDVSYITANAYQFVYTGEVIDFELDTENIPSFIKYNYNISSCVVVGEYDIVVAFSITENDCYDEVSHATRVFKIAINKATININDYVSLVSETFTYDFTYHSLALVGTLPQDVVVDNIDCESEINVGRYEVKYYFSAPSNMYEPIDTISAVMTINPAKLDITLKEENYVYTGESILPSIIVSGICLGDSCIATPLSNINVGEYNLIVNLSNTNYYVDTSNMKYNITPKNISLSGITLLKSEIIYSGKCYIPEIDGELPSEIIKFDLVYSDIKNVGIYEVTADIEVGSNYTVDNWKKSITVLPKSITVTFSDYDDLYYTGSVKSVNVTLNNVVDVNFDKYLVTYSNTPIEVGNYTCTVTLMKNTNYVIVGNNSITFRIYPNEKVVTNDDMSVTVQGMNGNISDLVVTCTTKDSKVEDSLKSLSTKINGYNVINLNGVDEEVSVKITTNLNVKNKSKIKVFKLDNGKLTEIDFNLNNRVITFEGNSNFQYVIVEEGNNSTLVIIIAILSGVVVILGIVVYFLVKKKHSKN